MYSAPSILLSGVPGDDSSSLFAVLFQSPPTHPIAEGGIPHPKWYEMTEYPTPDR